MAALDYERAYRQTDNLAWRAETSNLPFNLSDAKCSDGHGTMTDLFYSVGPEEQQRAIAICAGGCVVREACLQIALENQEPGGVWGGELFHNGKIIAVKRLRGRPPKNVA